MKKSVILMVGLLAMALAGSAQAATCVGCSFAVQDSGGANDMFTVYPTGNFNVPGSFIWDNVGKKMGIGTDTPAAAFHVNYKTALAPFLLERELDAPGAVSMQADNYGGTGAGSGTGAGMLFRFSKGTKAATAAVAVGDRLGFLVFGGNTGAAFQHTAAINSFVDAGTVSAASLPTYLQFMTTADGSIARTERLRIAADGRLRITNQPAAPVNGAVCTTSGDLILDATGGFLYLCNGATWKRATFN